MARAVFVPPAELSRIVREMKSRIKDWSVPMEKISGLMLEDTREVFADGLGEWAPLSPATIERWGPHPILNLNRSRVPLAKQNMRVWGPTNAAVQNTAPHAHFMEYGTSRYIGTDGKRAYRYSEKGERKSRAKSRALGNQLAYSTSTPARTFLFVDEKSYPKFETIILDYIEGAVSGDR